MSHGKIVLGVTGRVLVSGFGVRGASVTEVDLAVSSCMAAYNKQLRQTQLQEAIMQLLVEAATP